MPRRWISLRRVEHDRVVSHRNRPSSSRHTENLGDEGPSPDRQPHDFQRWLPLVLESRGLRPRGAQIIEVSSAQIRSLLRVVAFESTTRGIQMYTEPPLNQVGWRNFFQLRFPSQGLMLRLDSRVSEGWGSRIDGGGIKPLSCLAELFVSLIIHPAVRKIFKRLESDFSDEGCRLTFLPHNRFMRPRYGYRIFCNPKECRITAISQLRVDVPWKYAPATDDTRINVVQTIKRGARRIRKRVIESLRPQDESDQLLMKQGFVFDVFYNESKLDTELIELKGFGACSALLFDWVRDQDILYGRREDKKIEFRVMF